MAPPSFSDLGKAARDVFNTGYVFDVLKLDLKTNQNVEIKAGGTQHLASGAVNANLETKYVINKSKYCESSFLSNSRLFRRRCTFAAAVFFPLISFNLII